MAVSALALGPSDVLLDFGCGTGEILVEAARASGVRACLGVEIVDDLVATARRNAVAGGVEDKVTIEQINVAANWRIPPDVTCVYAFLNRRGYTLLLELVRAATWGTGRSLRVLTYVYRLPSMRRRIFSRNRAVVAAAADISDGCVVVSAGAGVVGGAASCAAQPLPAAASDAGAAEMEAAEPAPAAPALMPREYTLPRATKVKVPFSDDAAAVADPYAAAVYMFLYRFEPQGPPPLPDGAERVACVLAERSWP